MCGRYVWHPGEQAWVWTGAFAEQPKVSPWAEEWLNTGHYNIAPTTSIVMLAEFDGELTVDKARWGLIPPWPKDLAELRYPTFNARIEGIEGKSSWRGPVKYGQRCLIPATGFYEWTGKKPNRVPHFIHRVDGMSIMFAGLWGRWTNPETEEVLTSCTIITTEANDWMAPIHNRQPVILPSKFHNDWLDRNLPWSDVAEVLSPTFDGIELAEHEVTTEVNNSRNRGGPEFLLPATPT